MYRQVGMTDTHLGMILLYTATNVSLAVWLHLKFAARDFAAIHYRSGIDSKG